MSADDDVGNGTGDQLPRSAGRAEGRKPACDPDALAGSPEAGDLEGQDQPEIIRYTLKDHPKVTVEWTIVEWPEWKQKRFDELITSILMRRLKEIRRSEATQHADQASPPRTSD